MKECLNLKYDTRFTHDDLLDLMFIEVPKHSNGTKFYWSTSILNRHLFIYLKDGNDDSVFENNGKNPYLFGLPVIWDRTDKEIHLVAEGNHKI